MAEEFKVTEIDVATGESIERTPTKKEVSDYNLTIQGQVEFEAQIDAKIASRQSALAKLAALGLTEDEIAAL